MKTNQDGGSITAKDSGAAAKELKKNEDGAAKMGYQQEFGAARMSPSKRGDAKASELMHGAARYYDGAGQYMNGAPKYEGAGKYNGPMDAGHGEDPGHTHIGTDRPSYTRQTTTTSVDPGSQSSSSTITSGGGASDASESSGVSYSDAYKNADKTKYPTLSSFTKAAKAYNAKKKSGSTSSSSSSTSTQPTVSQTTQSETITSKVPGQSELDKSASEVNLNMADRYQAGQQELVNLAKSDSTKVAQSILKGKPVTESLIQYAVEQGNKAGFRTAKKGTHNRGTFDTNRGEFRFTEEEASQLFNPNIGDATATVTDGYTVEKHKSGSKNILNPDGKVNKRVKKGTVQNLSPDTEETGFYTAEDVGTTQNVTGKQGKSKGQRTITSVETETGSQGSFGGFNTAAEFLQNIKGGAPKMPKGPMKFGMKK